MYRRLLTAKPFLSAVELNGSSVSATTGSDPPVLDIKVRHRDPAVAATTAELIAEEFVDYAIEQRLAEIARVQSVAAIQGITNLENLVAAQLGAIDTLSILEERSGSGNLNRGISGIAA